MQGGKMTLPQAMFGAIVDQPSSKIRPVTRGSHFFRRFKLHRERFFRAHNLLACVG
jgi:hypothetical protein